MLPVRTAVLFRVVLDPSWWQLGLWFHPHRLFRSVVHPVRAVVLLGPERGPASNIVVAVAVFARGFADTVPTRRVGLRPLCLPLLFVETLPLRKRGLVIGLAFRRRFGTRIAVR